MELTKEQWVKVLTGLSKVALAIKQQNATHQANSTARDALDIFQEVIGEIDKQ